MKEYSFKRRYKRRWTYRYIGIFLMLITSILLLLIGMGRYYNDSYNYNVVKTNEEYYDASENYKYIKIYASDFYDLNIQVVESRSKLGIKLNESVTGQYIAIDFNGNLLVSLVPVDTYEKLMNQEEGPYVLAGKLKSYSDSDFEYIKNSLLEEGLTKDQIKNKLHVSYLDYQTPFDDALGYYMAFAILILLQFIFIPVMYKNTLALKRLKKYLNCDKKTMYEQIDNEVKFKDIYEKGPVKITENYIIVDTQKITFAMPLNQLVWAYKKTTGHKLYGIVPIKNFNELVLVFSDKSKYEISITNRKNTLDDIIEYIYKKCDKTFVGYSKEREQSFKKDFNKFIEDWENNSNNKNETYAENIL